MSQYSFDVRYTRGKAGKPVLLLTIYEAVCLAVLLIWFLCRVSVHLYDAEVVLPSSASTSGYVIIFAVLVGAWIVMSASLSNGIARLRRGEEQGVQIISSVCSYRRVWLGFAVLYYLVILLGSGESGLRSSDVVLAAVLPLVLIALPYFVYMECIMKIMAYIRSEGTGQRCRITREGPCSFLCIWFAVVTFLLAAFFLTAVIRALSTDYDTETRILVILLFVLFVLEGVRFIVINHCYRKFLRLHR